MLIVVAGPAANLILAAFVYWGLFWHGMEELKPVLGAPVAASAAAAKSQADGAPIRVTGRWIASVTSSA